MSSDFADRRSGTVAGRQANGETSAAPCGGAAAAGRSSPASRPGAAPGPGRPKYQPWPSVAPSARAVARCSVGLDALGEDDGAGALGVGVDRVHDLRDRRPGAVLHERRSSLTTSGEQQRQEGQRHRVGADVVDGDAPAEGADALDGAQQLGRAGGQGPLGDLQDDPQLPGRALGDGEQVVQRRAVEHLGLDVDEHGQRRQQALRRPRRGRRRRGRSRRARPAARPSRAAANSRSGRSSGPSGPRASAS